MSRPTTAQIIAQGDYLAPQFDPANLTIPHLIGIFAYHQIRYPSPHNKAKLVDLFNREIKAHAEQLMRQRLTRQETLASEDGILDGVSGLPISSSSSESQIHVRRSTRRMSRDLSQEIIQPEPPKRRRSSAAPALGQPSTRKAASKQPVLAEESEPEADEDLEPIRKVGRISKQSEAAGPSARRVSQKFGPGTEDSGWEDNNIFQSGAESSSPARSPPIAKTTRKSTARKSRKSLSAPPEVANSPPRPGGGVSIVHSPMQSKFEPALPQSVSKTRSRWISPSPIKYEIEDDMDGLEDNSGFADISADVTRDVILEDKENEEEAVDDTGEEPEEDEQTAEVSRRIASGGSRALTRRGSTPSPPTPLWQQVILGLIALALSGIAGQYKLESAPIGYCEAGKDSNALLLEMERQRIQIEGCHAQRAGNDDPDACPPLPLVPLPHPSKCTPCPAHAVCTRTTVMCDDGFLLRPHLLSRAPFLSTLADGLPALGPVAFPPTCVEDPMRKRNIGVLGKAIDSLLAVEHGKRLCAGVNAQKPIDGGEARRWGFEEEKLKEEMKRKAPAKIVANFDTLFGEAVQQLLEYGRVMQEFDSEGRIYLATEHVEMSWNCQLTVATRDAWSEWRRSIFGTAILVVAGLYGKARMAIRRAEGRRVAELVQIALDTLRNQEMAHHTDPITTPRPYLSSLQLRDVILQEEHAIPTRRRLWEQVERVVEGNANVRANLEELEGGDEARVWRWVGSSTPQAAARRVRESGESAHGRIVA